MSEKKIVVSIILRDALEAETPALSDDELVLNAEGIFLELDGSSGQPKTANLT